MPWISKDSLDNLHNQIDHWIDRFSAMELESTYWQAKALAADKEVRALNKAVKNKHKLKTALREATRVNKELLKMAENNLKMYMDPPKIVEGPLRMIE